VSCLTRGDAYGISLTGSRLFGLVAVENWRVGLEVGCETVDNGLWSFPVFAVRRLFNAVSGQLGLGEKDTASHF
jgi:hypothetical protein